MFGMFAVDRFAIFFKVVVLLSSSLAVVLSLGYLERHGYRPGESSR